MNTYHNKMKISLWFLHKDFYNYLLIRLHLSCFQIFTEIIESNDYIDIFRLFGQLERTYTHFNILCFHKKSIEAYILEFFCVMRKMQLGNCQFLKLVFFLLIFFGCFFSENIIISISKFLLTTLKITVTEIKLHY